MKNIRPITDLRKTNEISELCHQSNEPIFITKNGYNDLVIMSDDYYQTIKFNEKIPTVNYQNNQNNLILKNKNENHFLVKVGVYTNDVIVGAVSENTKRIIEAIETKKKNKLDILVFPELCITGYSCLDLFYQTELLDKAYENLAKIVEATKGIKTLIFVGAPLVHDEKIYNCAVAINDGKILAIIPKSYLPSYNEFYENRQFMPFSGKNTTIRINDKSYPFGSNIILINENQPSMKVACELCEDAWTINTPSTFHCLNGANIIVNLSASTETLEKETIRRELITSISRRLFCGYIYACAGNGESTTDVIYASQNIIAECGDILKESKLFENEYIESDIDIERIAALRRKSPSFKNASDDYLQIPFTTEIVEKKLSRFIPSNPFTINNPDYKKAIKMQALGLVKRLKHIHCDKVVLGLSGGLDSTLALLVCNEAFKILGYDSKNIYTLVLPAFGTSSRTYNNALKLCNYFNNTLEEINIASSVKMHLNDIHHEEGKMDVTYENAQARERTQVLFDYANQVGGIVIGTGDLSELCLGFATYNGDHMSNYGLNGSLPKTLIQYIVRNYAKDNEKVKDVLDDILSTPISPELLPTKDNSISQKTEEIVGPYELHDFFIYHLLINNYSINKIYYLATIAFENKYNKEYIKEILNIFIKKFFNNQFKRSCLPDGVKVTSVSVSPRGDFKMSSDTSSIDFLIK